MKPSSYWINKLNLIKHPTAGYAETYRSTLNVSLKDKQIRSTHSSIYYFLESKSNEIGYWRTLKSNETFHFYAVISLFMLLQR